LTDVAKPGGVVGSSHANDRIETVAPSGTTENKKRGICTLTAKGNIAPHREVNAAGEIEGTRTKQDEVGAIIRTSAKRVVNRSGCAGVRGYRRAALDRSIRNASRNTCLRPVYRPVGGNDSRPRLGVRIHSKPKQDKGEEKSITSHFTSRAPMEMRKH